MPNILKLKDFTKGWFVGNFEPNIVKTSGFEVGIKNYKMGDKEQEHYHKIATEITAIGYGRAKMCGVEISEGDIIVLQPGESTAFEAITDCQTIVVKIPSAKDDKFITP